MHPIVPIAGYASLGALVAWRVYARCQRLLKRQRLSKYRAPITLTLYPALVILVAYASLRHPLNLLWFAVALCGGAALGGVGLKRTKFETIPGQGLFYTPNVHLGIALLLLFLVRIVFRVVEVFVLAPGLERSSMEFAQNPFTLLAFGLLAGYNIRYAIGLFRWRMRVFRAKRAREKKQGGA